MFPKELFLQVNLTPAAIGHTQQVKSKSHSGKCFCAKNYKASIKV